MSVYKKPGRAPWYYDFQRHGHRFAGSTGCTDKRQAERWLKTYQAEIAARTVAAPQRRHLSLREAVLLYWQEVGQHHVNARSSERDLARLVAWLGRDTLLDAISDADVARLVARRRGDGVGPATVNRTVTEVLRKLVTRAGQVWQAHTPTISWRQHLLREPQERVRELRPDEQAALFAAIRDDYRPAVLFALLTGARRIEIVRLSWAEVDWFSRALRLTGKAGRARSLPITPELEAVLWPLRHDHPRAVFTYCKQRADGSRAGARGSRLPITLDGFKTEWRRASQRAGLEDFRFHDLRHTFATRVLRSSNLRVVQTLLGHAEPSTTARYAHVMTSDLAEAMRAAARTGGDSTDNIDNTDNKREDSR